MKIHRATAGAPALRPAVGVATETVIAACAAAIAGPFHLIYAPS